MAKDIRDLFETEKNLPNKKMPNGHETRFLNKLDKALPNKKQSNWSFLNIAASVLLVLGLGFGGFTYLNRDVKPPVLVENDNAESEKTMTLGDISPDLKKVEDYYVANINLELSKLKLTPENKELFDGYLLRLEELNAEYQSLSRELTENGPDEHTVNALINNLKFRLNLMHRLKEQLNQLNKIEASIG